MTASRAAGSNAEEASSPAGDRRARLIGRGVFVALVVATIAAFFVSQHLKVTTPFISGVRGPYPPAINPVDGPTSCRHSATARNVSERSTTVWFYLLHHADVVDVYVVNQGGATVRTVASHIFMRKPRSPTAHGFQAVTKRFTWNGRDSTGRPVPTGTYFFRVHLLHQQRTIELQQPVRVETSTACVWKAS